MTRRGGDDARERSLSRRRESRLGEGEARIVTCPDCRGHIRVTPGGDDPEECGGCGSRLLCATCSVALVRFTDDEKEDGICPRCGEPFDGEGAAVPTDEDFTWNDR
jgi:Zn-finger nucleic acid-binding protein